MNEIKKAVIIGNGNVGSHLAIVLPKVGISVLQVANSATSLLSLNGSGDIYIIAVKDDAIESVYNEIIECLQQKRITNIHRKPSPQLVVHTSGGHTQLIPPSDALIRTGVLYFLQSFTKKFPLDFSQIPVCIEAQDADTKQALIQFAQKLSTKIEIVDSQKRGTLHLAAVFANNFANLMIGMAQDLLIENNLSAHLLDALILETALKATKMKTAWEAQTGPALRNDKKTMNRHKDLLQNGDEQVLALYESLSQMIRNKTEKNI